MTDILVIGDTHIPDRAHAVPRVFKEIIEAHSPWSVVVFTGDFTSEAILSWVKGLGKNVYVVRGNMDYIPLPKTAVFEVEGMRVGVHHGDGFYPRGDPSKLAKIAQALGVDVLISGHTHADFVKTGPAERELLLNPGSLTGVWGGGGGSNIPSFMVLEAAPSQLHITVFRLQGLSAKRSTCRALKVNQGVWLLEECSPG